MILSGQTIRELGIFTPFCERTRWEGLTFGLGPAGYDVRVAESGLLPPGELWLASTIEHFLMPEDVLGVVHDKSTWARVGLTVQNTVIEPGWRGFLTIELVNHSKGFVSVKAGSPIAQIVLHRLDRPAERPYDGKYQDQASGPQRARWEG